MYTHIYNIMYMKQLIGTRAYTTQTQDRLGVNPRERASFFFLHTQHKRKTE
jgi:hypothetical protein